MKIIMRTPFFFLFLLSAYLSFSAVSHAGLFDDETAQQRVNLTQTIQLEPSADFLPVHDAYQVVVDMDVESGVIALNWSIAKGYFLYGDQFKVDVVNKLENNNHHLIDIVVNKESGKLAYDEYFEREVEKYYTSTTLLVEASNKTAADFSSENLILTLSFQGCADEGLCYPPETVYFKLDGATGEVQVLSSSNQLTTKAIQYSGNGTEELPQSLWLMLLFALIGGAILNLMPCVFPVLSIKVLSFMSLTNSSRHLRLHGWIYTAGIVCSVLVLAVILILLRRAGEAVGWGFQLQSPVFIAFLAYLFFLLGLSLSGLFSIGSSWMGLGHHLTEKQGFKSAFFTGVLAVLVSSPCSVPFMGVALGYALTQSGVSTLLVFVALGLGLALPFVLLTYFPQLVRRLPKPGMWMERFKQLLAFPLYLTVLWLLWVLGHQSGSDAVTLLLLGMLLCVFVIWLCQSNAAGPSTSSFKKIIAIVIVIFIAILPFSSVIKQPLGAQGQVDVSENSVWQNYSAERFALLQSEGKPIFIELTADWCITCLVNEKAALHRDAVLKLMEDKGVVYLRGDWTNGDPAITDLLREYKRGGVPLYLLFPAGENTPIILPQLLTEGLLLDALSEA